MKKIFQNFYKRNSLATTFVSCIIILLVVNLSIKTHQYSFGKIYNGEVVGTESFVVTKHGGSKYTGYRTYKTTVFPQRIKFTDSENTIWFYSETSWNDEVKYELNEKIDILETKGGRIYILTLFSFWFNTTNLVVIIGISIFLTVILELIIGNITNSRINKLKK